MFTKKVGKWALIVLIMIIILGGGLFYLFDAGLLNDTQNISETEDVQPFTYDADDIVRPPIHHWRLDNGLEVIFWENHITPVAGAALAVKASIYSEGKYLGSGISHYLEHVVAGGTSSEHTYEEYNEIIQKNGINYNGYTSQDMTIYIRRWI